ncbi:MAG: hypothetical protein HC923_13345 [Myxococcales bacterium]|nr:hypothetical protein [Myxococcales bacterium]
MRSTYAFALLGLTVASGSPVQAAEPPMPRIFQGSQQFGQGEWQIDILSSSLPEAQSMPKNMSMCFENITKLASTSGPRKGPECPSKVLKDTPQLAMFESSCQGTTTKVTVKKETERSFLVDSTSVMTGGERFDFKARYRYKGACSKPGASVKVQGSSEQCQAMKLQLAELDPKTMCADAPPGGKAACEDQIKAARASIEAICGAGN